MLNYKQLKLEFARDSFHEELEKKLGKVCCNCGSELDIEYHHVIPLALGGTNNITNIVPLCYVCHQIAHGSRNIRRLKRSEDIGRKRKEPIEGYELTINSYFHGDIGRKQCENELGLTRASKLTDMWYYKEFVKKNGIKSHKNRIDMLNTKKCKSRNHNGEILAYILYDDGTEYKRYID